MLTINEIKRNPTKIFARQADDAKKLNMDMLKYIEHLATTSSTNIAMWDIDELFRDKSNKKMSLELLKNKTEINQVFFSQKEKMATDTTEVFKNILKVIGDGVGSSLESQKEGRINTIQNNILSSRRNIEEYTRNIATKISSIVGLNKELDIIEGINTKDRIVADVESVLKGGFYDFFSFDKNVLTFATKNDIVCNLINPKAGLNLEVNLGKYKIQLNLENFDFKILPLSGNMKLNGHIHPFVGESGSVCFGNSQARANDLLQAMNISGIMQLMAAMFTTVTEDANPYVSLNSYHVEAERIKKGLPPSDEDESDDWNDSDEDEDSGN